MRETVRTRLCRYQPQERYSLNAIPTEYRPILHWLPGRMAGDQPAYSVFVSPDGRALSSHDGHTVVIHKATEGAWVLSVARLLDQYFDYELLEWSPPYEYEELVRGLPTVEAAQWLAEGWSRTGIPQALEEACLDRQG